ncbi:hypothetical protein [Myxosarcina sp. GI1]|uniref:hypothetical protein n=1 Tax=Myxosarcina sp. GI1 TaxID=1541065 RepID=UPI00068A5BBC|nr:hypothetical protein [Myxosarcina sp. GI1]
MAKNDFFLSPDDSQTLGDIDYMRKAKKVRKTFPKTLKNTEGFEITVETSSMGNAGFGNEIKPTLSSSQGQPGATGGSIVTQTSGNFKPQSSITTGSAVNQANTQTSSLNASYSKKPEQRRQSDSSMDMFRNMARDIKKGR